MSSDRHPRYTQEQPISDRGDGTVLILAMIVIVGVLLALNVAL